MLDILLYLLFVYSELTQLTAAGNALELQTLKRVRRVVGGYRAHVDEVPYLVNIRKKGIFECGGSLLTPKCIITAAHCVKEGVAEDFLVRGGVTYLNDFGNSRAVAKIFISPSYEKKSFENDVAIFQLKFPLFKGLNIATIPLMPSDGKLRTGDFVRVSGWGLTHEAAINPSNQLRSVDLEVLEQQSCKKLYQNYRNISDSMFCASIPGQSDACAADSGGPAVNDHGELVGIVSWGKGDECGRVSSPGVYVHIKAVRPWIDNILRAHCY